MRTATTTAALIILSSNIRQPVILMSMASHASARRFLSLRRERGGERESRERGQMDQDTDV